MATGIAASQPEQQRPSFPPLNLHTTHFAESPLSSPSLSSMTTSPRRHSPIIYAASLASSHGSPFSSEADGGSLFSLGLGAVDLRRVIRRKKSSIEIELEEERCLLSGELRAVVEPRPGVGAVKVGIDEVLSGRMA